MDMQKHSSVVQVLTGLVIVILVAGIYIWQLNQLVVSNTLSTISELAQHDKRSIEAYIESCWIGLEGMAQRFESYNCQTLLEVETHMNLERATSDFAHIGLLAEDGRIYTDRYITYDPFQSSAGSQTNLLPFFANGEQRVVSCWEYGAAGAEAADEYVLCGIRLENFEIEGVKMLALIGLSETETIQKHIILDSFMKNGERRGYSAVVTTEGDYVIGSQKTDYLNDVDNLYDVLNAGSRLELSDEAIDHKIHDSETFSFHYVDENGVAKVLYMMPFENDISWYFIMVVQQRAFTEQSNLFVVLNAALMGLILLVVALLATALSISFRRNVRAMAQAKAQSDFLSNMSHEIRTPLNGLIGLNHLIMTHIDKPEETEQIQDWLRKSHSTANYLLSLVNDVLDMSKLQAGRAEIVSEPVLLETLVDAVWSMQRDNIESRGVNFRLEQNIVCPCVLGDATRIKQVLMNIVGNAAKFTPKGGSITLQVEQEQTEAGRVTTVFRCQDTGVGMSESFVSTIFDAFSQERNRNSDSVKGTGLGMAISKLLMDAMGGEISVESQLNVGSTFTVRLPSEISERLPDYLDQCTPENRQETQELAENMQPNRPVKILVAEDNELNAEILLDILSEEGFEVVHAENGQAALAIFAASRPGEFNIILMDMQMPVMDGCLAAQEIRRLPRPDAREVIIFACTANTFKEDRDKALASGMNDFLAKPIDIEVMLQKLNARK